MAGDRLNIIYFVCHDLGKQLGCYGAEIETPNLDRFAAEGIRFNRAYTNAVACSPSRGCVMTGQYSHSNGLMGLVNRGWSMPVEQLTIVDYLNEAGYVTANFGIQHERQPREANRYQVVGESRYVEEAVPDAVKFLEDHRGNDQPFYLNIATVETHPSQWVSIDRSGRVPVYEPGSAEDAYVPSFIPDTPQTRKELACFQGCIRYLDRQIQTLFDAVDRLGYRDNTVVVFTNDHGVAAPRAKPTVYEAGTGISLLMQVPGISGETVDHLVQNIDCTPTLLEAAGVGIPESIQGKSFWSLLSGGDYEPHQEIFMERNYHGGVPLLDPTPGKSGPHNDPMRAVRTDRFRYIRHMGEDQKRFWLPHEIIDRMGTDYDMWWDTLWPEVTEPRDPEELFDLENDPGETVNLVGDPNFASVKEDLAKRLDGWMKDTEDPILEGPISDILNTWPDGEWEAFNQ